MNLLEHEGKRLFRRHGIAVPQGALWPELPARVASYAVKAQVRAGKRGKAGAVRFADSAAAAGAAAQALLGSRVGEEEARQVLIEERLSIARELYLAVAVERDARCRVLLASADGGVEIESVPAARLLRLPIDPQIGLRDFHLRRVAAFLAPPPAAGEALAATVRALYDLAVAEEALLAEINPLVLTAEDQLVAADAKVTLDGRAAFRHPDWADFEAPPAGSPFEQAVAAAGGAAVEVDPDGEVVGVISGAGLMMASLDMLIARGLKVRSIIDMGGTPLGGAEGLVPIFRAVAEMKPRVTFINAYFHTALADSFARGVLGAAEKAPLGGRVVLRLVGRNAATGRALLAPLGFESHDELMTALDAVAAAARDGG